jgi:hypothetical protein
VDGVYEDKFFGDSVPVEEDIPKRLRAVVQNLALDFAKTLRIEGHAFEVRRLSRERATKWIMPLIKHSRGKELPGTYNPLLIGNLFWEQSKFWEVLAPRHLNTVFDACETFLKLALGHLTTKELSSLILHRIHMAMKERLEDAKGELGKLLTDRRKHAITFNHYYTDNVQKSRQDDLVARVVAALGPPVSRGQLVTLSIADIRDCLSKMETTDMDDYACEEVLRSMVAYYKVPPPPLPSYSPIVYNNPPRSPPNPSWTRSPFRSSSVTCYTNSGTSSRPSPY